MTALFSKSALRISVFILIAASLYWISTFNYLLFHSLAELFSIIIAASAFLITWNSRKYINNNYLLLIGVAYLFIGFLDLLHTLSYKGMSVFPDYDYYANQVWIATRYLESITLLIAFFSFGYRRKFNIYSISAVYTVLTSLIILSIFVWKIFPVCFVEGEGLTVFKKVSEFIIVAILLAALLLLFKRRDYFEKQIFRLIFYSIIATILSELAFTFYIDNYGFSNLVGHYFKIISFALIYKAIISTGIEKPYDLIFRELRLSRDNLDAANKSKDRFFSIISHDLKNSFQSLIGITHALEYHFKKLDENRKMRYLKDIGEVSRNTYKLLENLLNWSRSQSGKLKIDKSTFDLKPLIEDIKTQLTYKQGDKNIEIESTVPEKSMVYADQNMIATVIRNLLSNAHKFSHPGSTITVNSTATNGEILVSVIDKGIGMSSEKINDLFAIDKSVSSAGTKGETGTGLGLLICKEFVEKHGGEIYVDSEEGAGTTISFTIDRAE